MATSASPQTGIYKKQQTGRGATMVFDEDGHLDMTSGSISFPGALQSGYLPLGSFLFGARQIASGETIASGSSAPTAFFGGLLMPDGAPQFTVNSTNDLTFTLKYASAIVTPIKLPPIALPGDLSTAAGFSIELYGESIGSATAADAAAGFDIRVWSGLGDTEMGATHPNFTTAPTWKGITIASGDINTSAPLNIILVPSAHAGRSIWLYDARITYTKKTS